MAAYLVPLREGRTIPIEKAVVFIGRHPECDVVLTRSRKVSRKHCCVVQVDDRYLVRDLGSMNGVRVNGRRVKNEAPLAFGDELAIADVHYVLRDRAAPECGPAESGSPPRSAANVPAGADRSRKPAAAPPIDISQDFPVPIAEESGVEGPHLIDGEDDVIPLASESREIVPLVDSGVDEPPHRSSSPGDDALPDADGEASDWDDDVRG
ncbi:MAG: FHA domain-containing protein [Planctomycetales bacterium]